MLCRASGKTAPFFISGMKECFKLSEVKVYQEELEKQYATGMPLYINMTKVKEGKVLRVTHVTATYTAVGTSEYIEIGYYNGHAYVPLYKGAPAVTGDPVFWNGEVWLRENQFIYMYGASLADGDIVKLRAHGKWE